MRNDDTPPDPAIEQAKEELFDAINLFGDDRARTRSITAGQLAGCLAAMNALIATVQQSSASRLQEVETARDSYKAAWEQQVQLNLAFVAKHKLRLQEVEKVQGSGIGVQLQGMTLHQAATMLAFLKEECEKEHQRAETAKLRLQEVEAELATQHDKIWRGVNTHYVRKEAVEELHARITDLEQALDDARTSFSGGNS